LQTAVIADQNGGKNVGKTNCGNDELAFLASAIKEGRTSRRRRLQVQLTWTTEDDFDFEFFLVQFVPVVGFFKIHLFCLFLSKTWLAVRHRTTCFPIRYTLIVFKYGTPHTEEVYVHQASIFRALEAKGTQIHIFPLFPHFVPSLRSLAVLRQFERAKKAANGFAALCARAQIA